MYIKIEPIKMNNIDVDTRRLNVLNFAPDILQT